MANHYDAKERKARSLRKRLQGGREQLKHAQALAGMYEAQASNILDEILRIRREMYVEGIEE